MTVGETLNELINAESYLTVRMTISDEFIDFVRENLPSDYEYIAEKEEWYQKLIKLLNNEKATKIV